MLSIRQLLCLSLISAMLVTGTAGQHATSNEAVSRQLETGHFDFLFIVETTYEAPEGCGDEALWQGVTDTLTSSMIDHANAYLGEGADWELEEAEEVYGGRRLSALAINIYRGSGTCRFCLPDNDDRLRRLSAVSMDDFIALGVQTDLRASVQDFNMENADLHCLGQGDDTLTVEIDRLE